MTVQAQETNKTKNLGKQLATAGAGLIAASIVLAILGIIGGTLSNVVLGVGLVLGVVGMVMSRTGKK